MFCYFCGKENDDTQKFCKYCGNSLHPTKQDENKSVSNKLLIAVIILLALILVALGLCLFIYIRSGATSPLEMFGDKSKQTEVEERTDVNEDYTDNVDEEALTEEPYEGTKYKDADTSGSDETEAAEVTEPKDNMDAIGSDKTDQTAEDKTDDKQTAAYEKKVSDNADNDNESKQEAADKHADDGFDESADTAERIREKLKISFAEASSVLSATSKDHATYVAGNVCDGNYKTAWVEGVAGNGEGQTLSVHLDGVHKISKIKQLI